MNPIRNSWCNFTYLGPRKDILDLPCRRESDHAGTSIVSSYWKPTKDELEQLTRGGTIELSIYGIEPIPPVSLGIVFTPDDLTPPPKNRAPS